MSQVRRGPRNIANYPGHLLLAQAGPYFEYICICDKLCFCREAFGDSEDDERSDAEPQALPSPENSPPRTPAFILYQERLRLARNRQLKDKLAAEEERLHDVAVVTAIVQGESEPSLSAAPSPSPPLPQPQAVPPPRAVRRLSMDNQRADSPPPRSPSPERAASPVVGARSPAQGSIRLGIGIGVRPSAPITAGYAHPRRGAICAQELRGPAPYMLL